MGAMSSRQRGFTLVELMIGVAIIGILAAVVVPSFLKESSKAKHESEVNAMFAELNVKLEQYKMEASSYLAAAECPSAGPNKAGYDFSTTCLASGSAWTNLRVSPPSSKLYCSYAITAGPSTTPPAPPAGFSMTAPATAWWYVVATCDMDASGGVNATFFASSVDPKVQSQNVGR
jgi:prepilin-type N-terminal cleavage/methylation domain-containing protein